MLDDTAKVEEMKIIIDEEVLRQALDAIGAALSDDKPYLSKCRASYVAIESALDAAEKVEPDYELVIDYGGLVLLRGELKHPHGTKLYTHPAPAVPEDEIEKLRDELASCVEDLDREVRVGNDYMNEAAQLREQVVVVTKERDFYKGLYESAHEMRADAEVEAIDAEDEIEKLRFQLEQYELSDIGQMQLQLEERRVQLNAALKERDELRDALYALTKMK